MSKTALLFAGQGAQVVGMGKDLAENSPAAKAWFDRANAALGYDLASICFNGPEPELTKTEHAQPGIFLVSWVGLRAAQGARARLELPGHGGLVAGGIHGLTAAGAMSFEDGLRVVRQRGRFMQEACAATQGGMAAIIGLDEAATREVCAEAGVALANLNCPGQIVISGPTEKLAPACELAKAKGAMRALPLPVAGAYHSPLMASAQPKLEAELARVTLMPPAVPVIANVTAQPHEGPEAIRARLVRAGHLVGALGGIHALSARARLHALHRAGAGQSLERLHEAHRQDRADPQCGGPGEPGGDGQSAGDLKLSKARIDKRHWIADKTRVL